MADLSVLIDRGRTAEAIDELATVTSAIQVYEHIPIAIVPADGVDEGRLRQLSSVVGVERLTPDRRGILHGFDRASAILGGRRHQWTVGGVEPGHPYPYVEGQPIGVAAPPAICAAINLSLGDRHDALVPTSPDDSVIHALHHVSDRTVCVVAAGNGHDPTYRFETLSPWAESDDVLAVGATDDQARTSVAHYSARGGERRPDLDPDVLAWGQSALATSERDRGTSFAAARVSGLIAVVRTWLSMLQANLIGDGTGVPLPGVFVIDKEFIGAPRPYDVPDPFPAIPLVATRPSAVEALRPLDGRLDTPLASRAVLTAAATTDSPSSPSPFISEQRLLAWLEHATAPDIAAAIDGTAPPAHSGEPLFDPGIAVQINRWARGAMAIWEWEIPSARGRMRHDLITDQPT